MSDSFKLVEGGIDCLVCPNCLSDIKLNHTYARILNDNGTLRLPCKVCEKPLKISYILRNLYIRFG